MYKHYYSITFFINITVNTISNATIDIASVICSFSAIIINIINFVNIVNITIASLSNIIATNAIVSICVIIIK